MPRLRDAIILAGSLVLANTAPGRAADTQAGDAKIEFEVASVQPASPPAAGSMRVRCTGGPGTTDPGTLTCENFSLSYLTMMAYNLNAFELSAPGWMDTARYNVTAKIPPGATVRQFQGMLQNLLAERFALKCHIEKKETQVFELVVGKNGSKLKEVEAEPGAEDRPPLWKPPLSPPGATRVTKRASQESMPEIAAFLSSQMGRPVADATGLRGRYDYTLTWTIDAGGRAAGPAAASSPASASPSLPDGDFAPTIVDAIRDQLGLRLEPKKGQAVVLVVDHADKVPVEN